MRCRHSFGASPPVMGNEATTGMVVSNFTVDETLGSPLPIDVGSSAAGASFACICESPLSSTPSGIGNVNVPSLEPEAGQVAPTMLPVPEFQVGVVETGDEPVGQVTVTENLVSSTRLGCLDVSPELKTAAETVRVRLLKVAPSIDGATRSVRLPAENA